MTTSIATLGSCLQGAVARGLPAMEARLLLMAATGHTRTELITRDHAPLAADKLAHFERLVAQRLDGEPVAYLLGHREFFGLDFLVTRDVLIPRPETELLVECALTRCAGLATPTVLDLGTGSGAIAVALASELPHAEIIATDLSTAALTIARHNAARLLPGAVAERMRFYQGDWTAALPLDLRVDIIVSNPPYIAARDPHLAQGDLRFEPTVALTDGANGLSALEAIIAGAPAHLKPNGWLLLEHGYDQAANVRERLVAQGFNDVFSTRDLAGIERVSGGRWTIPLVKSVVKSSR